MTKRILSFLLAIILVLSLVACNKGGAEDPTDPAASDPSGSEEATKLEKCKEHDYEETVIKEPGEFESGLAERVCKVCGKSFSSKRTDAQYCSNGCRQKSYRAEKR